MHISVDPHVFMIFLASETAMQMLSVMPDTDFNVELREILTIQNEILLCVIEKKHFGSDALEETGDFLIKKCESIAEMHESQSN